MRSALRHEAPRILFRDLSTKLPEPILLNMMSNAAFRVRRRDRRAARVHGLRCAHGLLVGRARGSSLLSCVRRGLLVAECQGISEATGGPLQVSVLSNSDESPHTCMPKPSHQQETSRHSSACNTWHGVARKGTNAWHERPGPRQQSRRQAQAREACARVAGLPTLHPEEAAVQCGTAV